MSYTTCRNSVPVLLVGPPSVPDFTRVSGEVRGLVEEGDEGRPLGVSFLHFSSETLAVRSPLCRRWSSRNRWTTTLGYDRGPSLPVPGYPGLDPIHEYQPTSRDLYLLL